jgi:hypothetical protein
MSVISLRLKDKEKQRIDELSTTENRDRSAVARELLDYGWTFLMISRYREGKISLGTLATKLELSMSEVIDLLAEYGVESTVTYEDYLVGFEVTD